MQISFRQEGQDKMVLGLSLTIVLPLILLARLHDLWNHLGAVFSAEIVSEFRIQIKNLFIFLKSSVFLREVSLN